MKRLFMSVLLAIIMGMNIVTVDAASVNKVVGAAADATGAPPPIPLTMTVMCTVSCPRRSAPSFTDSNRFWGNGGAIGSGCNTSVNGGATWAGCTTQPFTSGAKENYAGASDGSTIAIARVGGTTCTVKRSTDNGTIWTTVFTSTFGSGEGCGGADIGGFVLKCIANGECSFPYINGSPQTCDVLGSTDNGQSWAFVTVGLTGCIMSPAGAAYDGTNGTIGNTAPNGVSLISLSTVIGLGGYAKSAIWPAAGGTCWGTVNYNSLPHAICFGTSNSYELRSIAGVLESTYTLPGVLALANGGGLGVSLATNNLYVIATKITPSGAVGFWVTRDNGVTFNLIASTGGIGGMREGDAYFIHGCVFASFGASPVFTKVCL